MKQIILALMSIICVLFFGIAVLGTGLGLMPLFHGCVIGVAMVFIILALPKIID